MEDIGSVDFDETNHIEPVDEKEPKGRLVDSVGRLGSSVLQALWRWWPWTDAEGRRKRPNENRLERLNEAEPSIAGGWKE